MAHWRIKINYCRGISKCTTILGCIFLSPRMSGFFLDWQSAQDLRRIARLIKNDYTLFPNFTAQVLFFEMSFHIELMAFQGFIHHFGVWLLLWR